MESNKKILKIGLIIIAISVICSVLFATMCRLDKPVFLKSYIEDYVYRYEESNTIENIEIKYIANITDNRKVIGMEFKENKDIEVIASNYPLDNSSFIFFRGDNYDPSKGQIYGRYALKTIYAQINLDNIDEELYDIELNKAQIKFSDGSEVEADIGRFIIHKDRGQGEDIKTMSSTSSSDGTYRQILSMKNDIELLNMNSPIFENIDDRFELYVDGISYKEVSGRKYRNGSTININFTDKTDKDVIEYYTAYNAKPKLNYKDKNLKKSHTVIYNIDHTPYNFGMKSIFRYLRARGEI